jgi:hypothetical protein
MGKKKPTPKKVWQPLVKDPDWFREQKREQVAKMVREASLTDISDKALDSLLPDETWGNNRYTVNIHFLDGDRDGFVELAVHNHNRTPHVPWRHLQQIKDEVMGPDREAVQLFPADDRLVDTANEYWLYVYPVGKAPMRKRGVKLGMDHGRNVSYEAPEGFGRSRQTSEMEVQEG